LNLADVFDALEHEYKNDPINKKTECTMKDLRIIVIEDNKTLAKLIALKLETALSISVDVAHSRSEAELFTKKHLYTFAVVDLNLPDAPDGEIVDAMLSKGVPTIVLTGNIDKAFRTKVIESDIIDYVHKGGIEDIDYIIDTIKRLLKNRTHKVMVVDDSMVIRNQIKKMLEMLSFQVFALAHGEEALEILEQHPDIKLIITDYNMPVMDGMELTKAVRKKYTKNELAIFVVSSSENPEVSAMFLKRGANDFINKPFSKEEFSCRINNAIEALENIDAMTNMASRDFLTGLYNRRYFFSVMEPYFAQAVSSGEEFITAMIDIDHFKKINDTYGHDVGDKAIIHLSEILRSNTQPHDMVARFGGEEFCVVLKEVGGDKAVEVLERIRQKVSLTPLELEDGAEIVFTVSIGAALMHEDTLTDTINEADGKLYEAKNSGRNKVIF
jgi:diguanylate cyclase (GGDEF)-like protein